MQLIRHILLGFLLIAGGIPQSVLSKTITLINSSGESVELEVETTDQFLDVFSLIQSYFQEDALGKEANKDQEVTASADKAIPFHSSQLDLVVSHAGITVRAKKQSWRDYNTPVSKKEKEDITYIITTLANDSLISIGTSKSSLKKAGDRIDHLHPFCFLTTVFTDEKLKAGINAIRDRGGWIWSGFLDGIKGSLSEEGSNKNLLQFTSNFANKIKIDADLILLSIQQARWSDFINILIDKVPREIDPNRYEM